MTALSDLFRRQTPITSIRAMHLDLKGVPPTPARLMELLKIFAAARYNAVLVEWEDAFPWSVDKRFRSGTAYTSEQVEMFHRTAMELGLEVIPLVQSLGHMETPLGVSGYEHLREVPHRPGSLNPLAPGARELIDQMINDVLSHTPSLRYFHLGGDECWDFGKHPETEAFIQQHGKGALYMHHIEPVLDALNARGIRPLLWHDMMIDWDSPTLLRLGQKADLVVWGYSGDPDHVDSHYKTQNIARLAEHDIRLWFATAYKAGWGESSDFPRIQDRQDNAMAWVEVGKRFGISNAIATAWSRNSVVSLQRDPIDASLDSLVNIGVILHDGSPPDARIDACAAALDALGEGDRFRKCRTAMQNLWETRCRAWKGIQHLRECICLMKNEPRRRFIPEGVRYWLADVAKVEAAGENVKNTLRGLIEPVWIERYIANRLDPLREEVVELTARIRKLDPEGYTCAICQEIETQALDADSTSVG